jgi:L-methionine (R)-S-oxide reductase
MHTEAFMTTTLTAENVQKEVAQMAHGATSAKDLMARIVKLLHERMLKYNWVGFYMIENTPGQAPVLVLGEFQGAMTPHTRIQLHQGICGAAASSGKTVVVDDVASDPRYLACSLETKSEIVVPVFVKGQVVGELDIDSHFPSAFKADDRTLVEYCAELVGKYLETIQPKQ